MVDMSNEDHPEWFVIKFKVTVESSVICKTTDEVHDRLTELYADPTIDAKTVEIFRNHRIEEVWDGEE